LLLEATVGGAGVEELPAALSNFGFFAAFPVTACESGFLRFPARLCMQHIQVGIHDKLCSSNCHPKSTS